MAIIFPDSTCAICDGKLDRLYIATSGCAFPPEHHLWKFCDAPLHLDCLEKWSHRNEFSKGYFEIHLNYCKNVGHLLAQHSRWILYCGPFVSGRLPYFASVSLTDWPFNLYSELKNWTEFAERDFQKGLSGEALSVAKQTMIEVKRVAPDLPALEKLVNSIENKKNLFPPKSPSQK